MISAGEFVQASGSWINDRAHGVQFKASFLKATAPTTVEGVEKYLGSGMIRGIGPVYAKKLVRAFGETVFDVIEQEPSRLREVTGIGPKRAERIIAGWAEQKVIREIAPPGRITLGTPSPKPFRWNAERQAVEFGVEIGECQGGVWLRVPCAAPPR
jgi:ATP-dependent exoDNAse (exonuclease V) alpha subunit